jgi:hypothetical protein
MKPINRLLGASIFLTLAAAGAVFAGSDDGYFVRAGDAIIEIRISGSDPHYQDLCVGLARPDNLFFTLMRWARANENGLGKGPRVLSLTLRSDGDGKVGVRLTEQERSEFFEYPYALSRYEEEFFLNVLNRRFGIAEAKKLPETVSLIVLRPVQGKQLPTIVYPYTDIYRGPLPGSEMTGPDGRAFLACFYYKNIDRYLSDHQAVEFAVTKIIVDRTTISRLFK